MSDNILMMRCSKCGEMNQLPVVHCKRCGAKLDFDAAEAQMQQVGVPTLQDRVRLLAKLGAAAGMVLVILLILWPGKMTRTTGEEMDAKRYRMKGEILIDSLNRGMPAVQQIAEKDINAHFRELVAAQPKRGGMTATLQDVGARFNAGRAEGFIAVKRGPLTLTAHFKAVARGDGLVVTGAKVGHLPLPGILGQLYAKTQGGLFRQFKNESRVLRNLEGASIGDGTIELIIRSGK